MNRTTRRSTAAPVGRAVVVLALLLGLVVLLAGCQRERPAPEDTTGWEETPSAQVTPGSEAGTEPLPAESAPAATTVSVEGAETTGGEPAPTPTPAVVIEVTSPPPTAAAPPGNVIPVGPTFSYVVQPGDTLFSIAQRYDTDVETLRRINNLPDDAILSGQTLQVPGTGEGAQPPAATPEAGEEPEQVTYTVQSGDTLSSIASQFGVDWRELATANDIAGPGYTIYRGQTLVIPGVSPTPVPTAEVTTHTVQAGETLYSIAVQYGATLRALTEANGITNPDQIFPGQVLIIPEP